MEFVFDGEKADEAEATIERTDDPEEGGLIAEVSCQIRRVEDAETAEEAIRAIRDYDNIESVPVVDAVGEYAAELRSTYYEPGERELSYADAIHLAIASLHDDCRALYSGDPDFEGIDKIETVVL